MNDTISNLPTYCSQHHQLATTFVTTPTITTSNSSNTKVTTSFTSNNNNNITISSANDSMVNDPHIHKYRLDILAKPIIKKRSRSSRRTPATLLNTSTTDFRSLVQQFTGCHNMRRSFSKGPVNLSFGTATASKSHNNIIELATDSRVAPFGFGHYTNQQDTNPGQVQHQQQQEVLYTKQYEGMKTSKLDDFVIDDILTNEFVNEISINRSVQDGFYY